jgi:hypothetical protein
VTDQPETPETNGQKMSRLIREAPIKNKRQAMLDHLRHDWKNPTTEPEKENDRD